MSKSIMVASRRRRGGGWTPAIICHTLGCAAGAPAAHTLSACGQPRTVGAAWRSLRAVWALRLGALGLFLTSTFVCAQKVNGSLTSAESLRGREKQTNVEVRRRVARHIVRVSAQHIIQVSLGVSVSWGRRTAGVEPELADTHASAITLAADAAL